MHPVFTQTHAEERANALSHALGVLLALAAVPVTAWADSGLPQVWHRAGLGVFILTMLLMYSVSTVYHGLPVGGAKHRWRRWDHALIFLFIVGTFTPFAMWEVAQGADPARLVVAWLLALVGMGLKLAGRLRDPVASTVLYLGFGWLLAALAWPVLEVLPPQPFTWLAAGSLAYMLGCGFYLLDWRLRFSHLVWHLLVVAGSACHLAAALGLPAAGV